MTRGYFEYKQKDDGFGYKHVWLSGKSCTGQGWTCGVGALVLSALEKDRPKGEDGKYLTVEHLNRKRGDNRCSNLKWETLPPFHFAGEPRLLRR